MASLGPGKCVHCREFAEERNSDHVFPASWYPSTTTPNIEKWQIPSCIKCNREYGLLEEDLLLRLALCMEPDSPECAGVIERALRAIEPEFGRNDRDKRLRARKREKILSELLVGNSIPDVGVLPNFGDRSGLERDKRTAVRVPEKSLNRLVEKIVRGVRFLENETYIEAPYEIELYVLTDEGAIPLVAAVNEFGVTYAHEPGIRVQTVVTPEDGVSSLFCITIFGKLKLYASGNL